MTAVKISVPIQDFIRKWAPKATPGSDLEDVVSAMKALFIGAVYYEANVVLNSEHEELLLKLATMTAECRSLQERLKQAGVELHEHVRSYETTLADLECKLQAAKLPDGWMGVPVDIHPLGAPVDCAALLDLLNNPPPVEGNQDPNDYYAMWWSKMLATFKKPEVAKDGQEKEPGSQAPG